MARTVPLNDPDKTDWRPTIRRSKSPQQIEAERRAETLRFLKQARAAASLLSDYAPAATSIESAVQQLIAQLEGESKKTTEAA